MGPKKKKGDKKGKTGELGSWSEPGRSFFWAGSLSFRDGLGAPGAESSVLHDTCTRRTFGSRALGVCLGVGLRLEHYLQQSHERHSLCTLHTM